MPTVSPIHDPVAQQDEDRRGGEGGEHDRNDRSAARPCRGYEHGPDAPLSLCSRTTCDSTLLMYAADMHLSGLLGRQMLSSSNEGVGKLDDVIVRLRGGEYPSCGSGRRTL